MGAFFSNIQVYIDPKYSIKNREQLVGILKNELSKQGYEETDKLTEDTRTIAISNINNDRWISLYDEYSEKDFSDDPLLFITNLSRLITNPLVLISVLDSDILDLSLLRNGKLENSLNNQSQVFSKNQLSKFINFKGDKLNPWNILNLDKSHLERLNNVWASDYIFVEEILEKTAEIMNLNNDYCSVGFNYLRDSNLDDLLFLRFKKKESAKTSEEDLGPTKLEFSAYGSAIEGSVNEVKEFYVSLFNVGIESKGLSVGVYGEALENKYVEVDKILAINSSRTIENGEIIKSSTTKKDELILGRFNSLEIQSGFNPHSMDWSKMIEKRFASSMQFKIYLKLLKKCKSTINFVYIPHSNQRDGQIGLKNPIRISK